MNAPKRNVWFEPAHRIDDLVPNLSDNDWPAAPLESPAFDPDLRDAVEPPTPAFDGGKTGKLDEAVLRAAADAWRNREPLPFDATAAEDLLP